MTLEKYSMELKNLGDFIKKKRIEADKSPDDMGNALEISGRQFQRYESKGNFTVRQLLVIRDVLKYDIFRHLTNPEGTDAMRKIQAIANGVKGNVAATNSMLREILELLRDYEGLIGISSGEEGSSALGKNPEEARKRR